MPASSIIFGMEPRVAMPIPPHAVQSATNRKTKDVFTYHGWVVINKPADQMTQSKGNLRDYLAVAACPVYKEFGPSHDSALLDEASYCLLLYLLVRTQASLHVRRRRFPRALERS